MRHEIIIYFSIHFLFFCFSMKEKRDNNQAFVFCFLKLSDHPWNAILLVFGKKKVKQKVKHSTQLQNQLLLRGIMQRI